MTFEAAWENRLIADIDGFPIPFLGFDDLLRNKRSTARPQHLLDVELLAAAARPEERP